jgi:hypothetical protein
LQKGKEKISGAAAVTIKILLGEYFFMGVRQKYVYPEITPIKSNFSLAISF